MWTDFTIPRFLVLAAALGLAASQANAQGTPEQREACTPDAVRLCQDTIPDVGRTTACMAAHRAELSPRCQAVFDAGAPASKTRKRVARKPEAPVSRAAETAAPAGIAAPPRRERAAMATTPARHRRVRVVARGDRDTREARRVINRLCGGNLIDSGTCGFMGRVLTLAE